MLLAGRFREGDVAIFVVSAGLWGVVSLALKSAEGKDAQCREL